MQKFSYHTHTNFSDGKNSLEEMIKRAEELGWSEIGISDHLVVHKNFPQSISWPRLQKQYAPWCYRNDFKAAEDAFNRRSDGVRKFAKNRTIKVRVGAEVDFFDYSGWQEEFAEFNKNVNLDYYISGNHFLLANDDNDIFDRDDLAILFPSIEQQKNVLRHHFTTICKAAANNIFRFIAHIDHIRKIKITDDLLAEKIMVIEALKRYDMATEISTKGLRKGSDYYPQRDLLQKIISDNIKLVISDDAHCTDELGFGFSEAESLLSALGCCNRWSF